MRAPISRVILLAMLALALPFPYGCAGGRLSSNDARRRIAEISGSKLVPDAIAIRRIAAQSDREAIAETSVELTFQFRRENNDTPWRVASVRMGTSDWIDVTELFTAVNESRRTKTMELMGKLSAGVMAYAQATGMLPVAADITKLSDLLFPRYMNELIRDDAWGHPIHYKVDGNAYTLSSDGAGDVLVPLVGGAFPGSPLGQIPHPGQEGMI